MCVNKHTSQVLLEKAPKVILSIEEVTLTINDDHKHSTEPCAKMSIISNAE